MKKIVACFITGILFLLAGCSHTEELHSDYLFAMDTFMEWKVYGSRGKEGIDQISGRIEELEALLSVTDSESQVYQLNQTGYLEDPSADLVALLTQAQELGMRTSGALDVTIYPVVRAWGFTGEEYHVPAQEELEALLACVDYTALDWTSGGLTIPAGYEIDLGSLVKGYAGTEAANILRELGVKSALLNLGGNVQTVGAKPDGSCWRVAVKDPLEPDHEIGLGILELNNQAAVTSGGYERYFEENGQVYWHIIDPMTGYPAQSGLLSVTVVGENGAVCDGLSTAFFIMGKEKALEYWRTWDGFNLVLLEENGTVTVTGDLVSSFTLTNQNYTLVEVIA